MRRAGPVRYSSLQKWLHWGMALLIVVMIGVGLTMTRMAEGRVTNGLYELHKSFGVVVFTLAILRLLLRWVSGAPQPVPTVPLWQRTAARLSHGALYALIIAVPLAGWFATSFCCGPVKLFWTVDITAPVFADEALAKAVFWLHLGLALSLAGLVLVHVAAALQHHFIRRDETLRRMLPDRARAPSE
jgi:cytochrome b561